MKILKTKWFTKWARKNDVDDALLCKAACEVRDGIFEAHYGHGVIKKRIASHNRGKSAGIRIIIIFKKESHCFLVYGFAKNEKVNISSNEEKAIKLIASELLSYEEDEIQKKVIEKRLIEIKYE